MRTRLFRVSLAHVFFVGYCFVHSPALQAAPVEYRVSVDDFVSLSIDGVQVASYDGFPWVDRFFTLDLPTGWYSFDLTYRNRFGSTALYFFERATSADPWEIVPRGDFRSLDGTGTLISGLRADYSLLTGTTLGTVFGEGPIAHGWFNSYQGATGDWGHGWFDTNWGSFQERLTGEIFVGGAAVPEPASISLLIAAALLGGMRKLLRPR